MQNNDFYVIVPIYMNKIINIFKNIAPKKKKYLFFGIPLILILLFFVLGKGKNSSESYVVNKTDVVQSAILSGKVMTSDRADLGFATTGRVNQIFVKNNQSVAKGQILAQLEIGDLLADLKIKQANLRQENTEIESTYRTLLTEGLELVPSSNTYDVEPPTVSGIYDGLEGQYKVTIKRKNITLPDFTLLTFNLEKTEEVIEEEGSTPLGTKGLYISFPDADISEYQDTTWYLDIPNKSSSSYLSNLNSYNEAKNDYDKAVKNEGVDSVAQAEIQKINAEIRKNTIYAPFKGVVTNIEKEVGENASTGERVISILGEDKLEVVLEVSELDVSRLTPGASIKITLDAFSGEDFSGILKTINSRETEIDGVPVYEAFVELEPDPRIKTGMSANGTIVLVTKNDVLAIPNYFIKKIDNRNIVEVVDERGNITEREVVEGLLGTDSMVEIISGLNEGEKIISTSK